MRVGIIVALNTEAAPFAEAMKALKISPLTYPAERGGFEVKEWIMGPGVEDLSIFMVVSGAGIISAAAATQLLVDKYYVDKIINYGVVGCLKSDIPNCTVGYVKKVIKHDLDCRPFCRKFEYPGRENDGEWSPYEDAFDVESLGIREFVCASGDKVILAGDPKRELQKDTGADICEMEAASVMWVTKKAKIPVLIIKAVSDGVDEDEEAFQSNIRNASKLCVKTIKKALNLPEPKNEE